MSTSEFDIIFRGDIVLGHQLADVKTRLQQLFKTDAARIDALFTGRPVTLKRKLDEASAHKYRDVLIKAGAMVEICPSDRPASGTPATAPSVNAGKVQEPESSRWTIAPAGAELLPSGYRSSGSTPNPVKVPELSLRPAGSRLVDAQELGAAVSALVAVPNFDVAPAGEPLLSHDERLDLPLPELELANWEVAAAGSDLLNDDEKPVLVPVVVAQHDFSLAPPGSDLGQLKPQVRALVPDISGLGLVEPR